MTCLTKLHIIYTKLKQTNEKKKEKEKEKEKENPLSMF